MKGQERREKREEEGNHLELCNWEFFLSTVGVCAFASSKQERWDQEREQERRWANKMGNCGTREESAVVANAHAQGQLFVSLTFLSLDLLLFFLPLTLCYCRHFLPFAYFFLLGNDLDDDDSWSWSFYFDFLNLTMFLTLIGSWLFLILLTHYKYVWWFSFVGQILIVGQLGSFLLG